MVLGSRAGLAAALVAAALAGCGSADDAAVDGADGGATSDRPTLVATTSVWADITSRVACGEAVAAVIPAGSDPHTYEPSLRDRELLEDADVVVANGSELEATMQDLLATVDTTVVEIAARVDLIIDDHDDDHPHEEHEEHEDHDEEHDPGEGHGHTHEGGDPHIWLDPTRVAGALDLIASALVDRDPASIRRCTDEYRAELTELDRTLAATLADVPADRRLLVTNHESLTYFADRYDFDVIGTVLPGTSTLAETNPAELELLADLMIDRGVGTIFVEEAESDDDARALADRVGAEIVPLLTGSLADTGPSSSYTGMLRTNAEAIAAALGVVP